MSPESEPSELTTTSDSYASAQRFVGWLTLCYWGALFVSTHVPLPPLPGAQVGSDKVMHVAAFAGLGLLAALWLALGRKLTIGRILVVFVILGLYGAIDEWLQQFVNRVADFDDWVADLSGAAIGLFIGWVLQTVWPLTDAASDTP